MATSRGSRDVKISLSVETLGEEGIKTLQRNIAALAKEGGDAAPEFERLANEIQSLGQQAQALETFRELAVETDRLGQQQAAAAQEVKALAESLGTAQVATNKARAAQREANQDVLQARVAYQQAGSAIKEYKVSQDSAARATGEYRAEVQRLTAAEGARKVELLQAQDALRQTNGVVNEAVQAERNLESTYARRRAALQALTEEQRQSNVQTERAAAAARELGVSVENVAAEQARLLQAFNQAGAAAQRLSDDVRELAEADRLLVIQQRAMEDALARGVVALNQEKAALADAERLTARLAQETAEAAARIDAAFRQVGVRSLNELQTEISQTRAAMATLAEISRQTGQNFSGAFASGAARIAAAERQIRELNGTLTLGDRAAKLFANSMGQIAAGNVIADGVGFLINKVKELGIEFFSTNIQLERLRRALGQVYGDTQVAAQQLQFLRQTANASGLSVGDLSDAFVRFSAATRNSGVPLETINGIFAATARAAGVLGLSSEQVTGTIEALGQMASKGTISMEELRGQMGDRLPGALSIAAKGLGVTEAKLVEMVSTGNLTTRVFFPAFEKGLRETFGSGTARVEGFIQAWNRLKNAVAEVAQRASDTAFFTTLGKAMDVLATNINGVVTALTVLAERYLVLKAIDLATGFVNGARAAATSTAALVSETAATVANTTAKVANTAAATANAAAQRAVAAGAVASTAAQTAAITTVGLLSGAAAAAGGAIRGLLGVIGGLPGALALVLLNARELGTWLGESVAKFTSAGAVMKRYEEATKAQADAEKKAAEQKRLLAAEQDALAARVAEAATKEAKIAELAVTSAEKRVKAVEAQNAASEKLAQISGNEQAALQAAAVAATALAIETGKMAAAKADLVVKTEAEIAAIEKTRDANGKLTEKQQEQVNKLKETVEARRAEAQEAKASAEALDLERVQRTLMSELYKDNSNRIKELEQAYENARAKVEILNSSGVATAQQLRVANAELGAAARLVNDAYADQAAKIRAANEVAQANVNIKTAGLQVEQQAYQALANTARASGDLARATYYEIEAKNRQIEITRLTAQAKRAEADATIDAAEAEKAALQASGNLTEVKRLQIDATIANARAKRAEAEASEIVIRAQEQEKQAIRDNANARAGSTAGIDKDTDSRLRNASAIDKQTESLKNQKLTSDGFATNKDGSAAGTFTNTLPLNKIYELQDKQRAGTLTADDLGLAEEAYQQAFDAKRFVDGLGTFASMDAVNSASGNLATTKTILDSLRGQAGKAAPGAGLISAGGVSAVQPGSAGGSVAPAGNTSGSSKTVNINFNGRSQGSVNVASAQDAEDLTRILRGLETASGSST